MLLRRLTLLAGAIIFIVLLVTALYILPGGSVPPPPASGLNPADTPPLVTPDPQDPGSKLPGVVAAVVDNKAQARPQSGLDRADLVVEMMAEGGITRYLAFFYSQAASTIGPIRSARPYFAEIAKAYKAPLAHAGGSVETINHLRTLTVPSIDEINNAGRAFWRDPARNMPHNLYTSTELLLAEAQHKRYPLHPLPKRPEGSMPVGESAPKVLTSYSPEYKVEWRWSEGVYHRYINGAPHTMRDGTAITVRNVVFIAAPHRQLATDAAHTVIDIIGTGTAWFLRDGQLHRGTWAKDSPEGHFNFTVNGADYLYSPGNTWIQIVTAIAKVSIVAE